MTGFSIWIGWTQLHRRNHIPTFRELLKVVSLIIDLCKCISLRHNSQVARHMSINRTLAQQNYPACTLLMGKEEAFNKSIKKQQYKSEVTEWRILFHLHQYSNSICLIPVFGSYGLFILNSIIVIPSLSIVCNYDQMSMNLSQQLLWTPSVLDLCP